MSDWQGYQGLGLAAPEKPAYDIDGSYRKSTSDFPRWAPYGIAVLVLVVCIMGVTLLALLCAGDTRHVGKTEEKPEADVTIRPASNVPSAEGDYDHGDDGVAEVDAEYWRRRGQQTLWKLVEEKRVDSPAKNVIVFIGDGMGISTVTAGRIYKGQLKDQTGEESSLSFEGFPYTALLKTYAIDTQVVDSAASGTALFTGVKTNSLTLGLSARAKHGDCNSADGNEVQSFMTRAQKKGMSTGFVTTTRVTHATPAALYSHSPDRNWEEDSSLPKDVSKCKDIARQLVEDKPGRDFNVILGGGVTYFKPKSTGSGKRMDGRDLVQEWKTAKGRRTFVSTADDLRAVNVSWTSHLMGLFASSHMAYEAFRREEEPSLTQMVATAIMVLRKNAKGYVLMVEGGRIDHAHHYNNAQLALRETVEFSEAVQVARTMTSVQDTLILVTADHSHSFVINGYAPRGNPIWTTAGEASDGLPYMTLGYTNGPSKTPRARHSDKEMSSMTFQTPVLVPLGYETHAGEDVALYASGPMAHLFRGVLEQNLVAHIVEYAACLRNSTEGLSKCTTGHVSSR